MEEKKPVKIKFKTVVIIIVTAVVLLGIGANVYASVNGYGNIFFLIKYLTTGEKTEIVGKDELLSDRDITISYESITLSKDIKLQIKNLQIKNDKANLILVVSESAENSTTPLKYKVYNGENKLICEQNSSKNVNDTQYTEELALKGFSNNDKIISLEVYSAKGEKITKITINIDTREVTVEGEKEAVEKISEIKLKEFLGYISAFEPYKDSIDEKILFSTAMLNKIGIQDIEANYLEIINLMLESCGYEKIPNSFEPTEYFKPGKYYTVDTIELIKPREGFEPNTVVEIKDISYCGGIYTVKFIYTMLPPEGTINADLSGLEYKEATVEFELNENKDYSEFKVIKFTQETKSEENTNTEMGDAAVYVITVQRFNKLEKIYMHTNDAFELGEYTDKGWKVLNHDEVTNNLFTENMKKTYKNRLPDLLQIINNQAYVGEGGGFYSYDGLVSIDIINYTDDTINVSIPLRYLNTNFEFLKTQNVEMKLVKQDGKWLIDSFDVTKFYEIPDGAVVGQNNIASNTTNTTNYNNTNSSNTTHYNNSNTTYYNTTNSANSINYNNTNSSNTTYYNNTNNSNTTNTTINNNQSDGDIDNSATSIPWKEYFAPGIKFQYPTNFDLHEIGGNYSGFRQGEISTIISGVAVGKDENTGKKEVSNLDIYVYEPKSLDNDGSQYKYNQDGYEKIGITTNNGLRWYEDFSEENGIYTETYIYVRESNKDHCWIYKIEFKTNNKTSRKVANIIDWFLSTTKTTSY